MSKSNKNKMRRKAVLPGAARVTGAQIARLAGISPQRVSVLLAQGKSAGEIILSQELKRSTRAGEEPGESHQPGGKPETYLRARARKESILADLRAIELKRRRGELAPIAELQNWFAAQIIYARNALLLLPSRLRDELGACDGPACEELLKRELCAILEQIKNYGMSAEYDPSPPDEFGALGKRPQ
jgi:hypothetical protein